MIKLPRHECGLSINHNEYKNYYETVEGFLGDGHYSIKDDDSRKRMIETGEVWTIQWYPDTPIGFYSAAAPTLEELLEWVNSGDFTED